ncbi:M48 family metallopeptidase [Pedococcus sp. NPDC057267]|uniref:M48 family metallopeptidase n=1 Tax=Pedococcus sp. NPDC057267 TaxID=3346077 RepID=UPI0036404518
MAPFRGTSLLGRVGFWQGRRLDERLLRELSSDPVQTPQTSLGFWWLLGMSLIVVVLDLACLVAAVWVWVETPWPKGVQLVVSLGLLGLAVGLLPTPMRAPKAGRIPDGQGTRLRGLVDEVAAAVGAETPDLIVIDLSVNAAVARYGWRQQTLLIIGAPLWAMLTPAGRLAVLAHELGHIVNKDPMRSVLTFPARSFGARAIAATGGRNPWARALAGTDRAAWSGAGLGGVLVHGSLALINTFGATIQLLVDSVAMPDSRRAEYLADLKARQVAGSEAFIASSERLLLSDGILQDLWDLAPRLEAHELPQAIETSARRQAKDLMKHRQATLRSTDLWSTHPAEGDRMTLVEALPQLPASLHVSGETWDAIDAEMSAWYAHLHRKLLGTRDRIAAS